MPAVNKTETIQLNQWQGNEYPKRLDFNEDNLKIDNKFKEINQELSDLTYKVATGTATAIILTMPPLINGYAKTFIASANNNGQATTINGKPLYKPNTTTAPNLIGGKAYTVWYDSTKSCFFIKASAEGNTIASHVLAGDSFSNDSDTGLVGTMPSKGAQTYTPATSNQTIAANQYLSGVQTILGDSDLISANIKSGINIFGVAGSPTVVDTADAVLDPQFLLQGSSGYDDGVKKAGTMINRSSENWHQPAISACVSNANGYGAYLQPPRGFYDGNSWVRSLQSDLIAQNIIAGKNILGIGGSASVQSLGGYAMYSTVINVPNTTENFIDEGGYSHSACVIDVTGFNFMPKFAICAFGSSTSTTIYTKDGIQYCSGIGGVCTTSKNPNMIISNGRIRIPTYNGGNNMLVYIFGQ